METECPRVKGAVFLAAALLAGTFYGCGGGGGGNGASAPAATTVSGVAATGAAMSGSAFLKDSTNTEMTTTIHQNGTFSFYVSGKTGPFMLRAGSLYSMSGGSGTANINPFSQLMVADMGGFANMSTMNSFYRNPNSATMQSMFGNMSTARLHLRQKMGPLLTTYGVPSADPIMGAYTIGQGMDKMFDDVKMSIDPSGNVSMMYVSGTQVFNGPMGNMMGGNMMSGNIQAPGTVNTASTVVITPAVAKLQVNQSQQFTANMAVTWAVNGGSVTSSGVYTAPAHPGMFLLKATSASDPTQTTTATIQVGNMGMMM